VNRLLVEWVKVRTLQLYRKGKKKKCRKAASPERGENRTSISHETLERERAPTTKGDLGGEKNEKANSSWENPDQDNTSTGEKRTDRVRFLRQNRSGRVNFRKQTLGGGF